MTRIVRTVKGCDRFSLFSNALHWNTKGCVPYRSNCRYVCRLTCCCLGRGLNLQVLITVILGRGYPRKQWMSRVATVPARDCLRYTNHRFMYRTDPRLSLLLGTCHPQPSPTSLHRKLKDIATTGALGASTKNRCSWADIQGGMAKLDGTARA